MELISEPFKSDNEIYKKLYPYLHYHAATIAGGGARQLYLNNGTFGTTDIDLYFLTKRNYNECKKEIINNFILEDSYRDTNQPNYPAVTYIFEEIGKIQFIKKIHTGTIDLFNSFDFTCCQFALFDNMLYYTKEAVEDFNSKTLKATPTGEIHNYRNYEVYTKGLYSCRYYKR